MYTLTNLVKSRPRFDKSRVTERAQDVHLRIAHFRNRKKSFTNTAGNMRDKEQ